MSSRPGVRSRRTRVYDCNYNMGESYYRSALDKLDRKNSGRPEVAEATPSVARDIEERYGRAFANEDLTGARRRAEKVISEDSLFDSRGGRAARGRPLSAAIDDDNEFDEEVSNSLRRLRANKKKSVFMDDVDMESTVSNLHSRSRLGLAEKILESAGVGESSGTRRRVTRVDDSTTTARWTAVDETSSSAASRARASRARLSDLEEESNIMQKRQAARESRAADYRAYIVAADAD
ncbi:uncharacterized protein LOC143922757 [Arctopsyche grandis]|uniref:uncharacterized protein LOC143922757 n=1 Tax=Arctopsyche grandis TaxID=121162 RepID=UPI00406D94AA